MIGSINYTNGLFLGREELFKQQSFLNNNLTSLIRVLGNKGLYPLKDRYNVTFDNNNLIFDGPKGILGIDNSLQVIYFNKSKSISLSGYVSTTVYLSLSSNSSHKEAGTITISLNGDVTGVDTKFTESLRASFTKKGSKIFIPSVNKTYSIESITSNTVAKIIGTIDTEITNVEWCIVGTFSPFTSISSEESFPYTYYSYSLNLSTTLPNETDKFIIGKVSWIGGVPLFEFIQDSKSLLGSKITDGAFDYIVDSDESLKLLRGNSQATNILIKKGTYTYTSTDGKGLALHPNVRLIWAEAGSLIKLYSSVSALSGSFAFGYNNPQINSSYFYNLNIENNSFPSGYKNMNNLLNCTLKYTSTAVSYGYDTCHRLINCIAESVNAIGVGVYECSYISECLVKGFATGFVNSTVLSKCYADCSAGYSNSFASKTSDLNFVCADTANGGFNASLNDVPPVPPPTTNNNIISFQIEVPNSIYRRDVKLKVYSQYAVASTLNFNLLIINSLNKEEEVNIHLSAGENFKEKDMSATLLDPAHIYSITAVAANLTSDATYTYILNY